MPFESEQERDKMPGKRLESEDEPPIEVQRGIDYLLALYASKQRADDSDQKTSEQTSDEHEVKPHIETGHSGNPVPSDHESDSETSEQPSDWRWYHWAGTFFCCFLFVTMFGTKANNAANQNLLNSVIFLQTSTLTFTIRTIAAFISSPSVVGVGFKVIAIGALCFVMLLLTTCSILTQSHWGFG